MSSDQFVEPPKFGRWSWPFSQMAIGDNFKVRPQHKSKADVRNMAHVRGYQLGKYFHTSEDKDGNTVVTRVLSPAQRPVKLAEFIDYGTAIKQLRGLYPTLPVDSLPLGSFTEGERSFYAGKREGELPVPWLVVDMNPNRQGITLRPEGVLIQWIPKETTYSEWIAEQMLS